MCEWHPSKNEGLNPSEITHGSNKVVWWKCEKSDDHQWTARVADRVKGGGCPYCLGRRVSKTNNLKVRFPEIATEWHPDKNIGIKPSDVTCGSRKKSGGGVCTVTNGHQKYTVGLPEIIVLSVLGVKWDATIICKRNFRCWRKNGTPQKMGN